MKTKIYLLATAIVVSIAIGCSNRVLRKTDTPHYSSNKRMVRKADAEYKADKYSSAASMYENALKDNASNNDPKAMLRLADCYYNMNRYADAETWYSKSISSPEATALDKRHYAEVLKAQGKCEEANGWFETYIKEEPSDKIAKNMLESCKKTAKVVTAADSLYAVNQVDLGFVGSSFSPSRFGEQLFVTASTPHRPGTPVDEHTGKGFLDLYLVTISDSSSIAVGEPTADLSGTLIADRGVKVNSLGEINTEYHEGAAIISPDGKMLLFTRSKLEKNNQPVKSLDNENHLELCSAEMVGDKWTNVTPLPFSKKEYSSGHPAMTSDGKRLYFISDMSGGYGGTDIYYTDYNNGEWSKPVNAGATINTEGNEMFPSIRKMADGRDIMYFSSNGHPGEGGLDLFRSEMNNNLPGDPVHLASPFNSSYDDFGMCYNADGSSGYFSSNRGNNEGIDNIHEFKRKPTNIFIKAHVVYKKTMQPVGQAKLEITNTKTSDKKDYTADNNGTVIFRADSLTRYDFVAPKEGYITGFKTVNTPGFTGKLNDTIDVTLYLDKIEMTIAYRIENIYYDFDRSEIRPDAAIELNKLVRILNDNPTITVELGSHCDARGSYEYNDALSQRRADAAIAYIISQGISANRITAKGYGERVLQNQCSDGIICTEEEHQWNRRTEFRVTGLGQELTSEK
jgi:outer membrane protein OmpA-like peptidoglycan-associated protein/tetratricopeptide (TPR) repeat protein